MVALLAALSMTLHVGCHVQRSMRVRVEQKRVEAPREARVEKHARVVTINR